MANSVVGGSAEKHTCAYFDRLPRSVRAAVANARFDWTVHKWLMLFERGQISAKELVKRVERVDREASAKERLRIWGADYPVLAGELPSPKRKARR